MSDAKRLEWVREKIEHGLGVDGSLFDELNEHQGGVITSYLDGGDKFALLFVLSGMCVDGMSTVPLIRSCISCPTPQMLTSPVQPSSLAWSRLLSWWRNLGKYQGKCPSTLRVLASTGSRLTQRHLLTGVRAKLHG